MTLPMPVDAGPDTPFVVVFATVWDQLLSDQVKFRADGVFVRSGSEWRLDDEEGSLYALKRNQVRELIEEPTLAFLQRLRQIREGLTSLTLDSEVSE